MQARNWLITVVGLVAASAGLVIGVNAAVDPYGLYRDAHGRKLRAYGDSRVSKYLLNVHYVAENFNAVLVGSSVSANWDTSGIEKLRVYNDSLDGGNIVEEKALVDQLLSTPGIEVAFLIVHPYLTSSHSMETVKMAPSLKYSGLGSDNLLTAYKDMLKVRMHRQTEASDAVGTERFEALPTELNPTMKKLLRPGVPFEIDPVALAAYRDTIEEFRAHHVQLVFVVPPIYEELLEAKAAEFRDYHRMIEASMRDGDLLMDFTGERFADFRKNRANFGDGVHVYTRAAAEIVSMIREQVDEWIGEGRLRVREGR